MLHSARSSSEMPSWITCWGDKDLVSKVVKALKVPGC